MKRNISEKVILTNQCNCYCTYCYQQNKIDWVLSYDIAKKRINQLIEKKFSSSFSLSLTSKTMKFD